MIVLLAALGFVGWLDVARVRQVEATSALVEELPATDAASPTGYAGGTRVLIVPEHIDESYQWIAQTQQMLAQREWRVRHIDYENAPFGREVFASSPYRWWLGLVAWCDHAVSGRPPGQSVERAALYADPLLHLLLLAGATIFTAWRFGPWAAALVALGLVALFPFAAEFLPGVPANRGLAQAAAIATVLMLLAGVSGRAGSAEPDPARAERRTRRWFLAAGIIGGLGLWVSPAIVVPVLGGLAGGGLLAAWIGRREPRPLPWRAWAAGGGVTTLIAYLIEFLPSHLGSWQLRAIHPLYGVAWLGAGEVLARLTAWIQGEKTPHRLRAAGAWLLAAAALAAVPVALWRTKTMGFLEIDLAAERLARLPDKAVASSFTAWLFHDGFTPVVWGTTLPLLLLFPAAWFLARRATGSAARTAIALAPGPTLLAFGFACQRLCWWAGFDAAALPLMAAITAAWPAAEGRNVGRWIWGACVALLLGPGVVQLLPAPADRDGKHELREPEVYGLIERDLARWFAVHVGSNPTIVLAPHNETSTLYFYGGVRGLGSLAWENQDGVGAAVRIVSASTPEEAKELIDRRGITHLVMPSWDSYLEVYARMGMGQLDGTFLQRLLDWKLPPWLKPVPYQLPVLAGLEGQSVTILEVVEDQDDASALSRIAEYFVEMNQLDKAASAAQALRRFPADLGALVARAQVENAVGDNEAFARTVELLKPRLAGGGDRSLAWDRRVGLAVVLARSKEKDLARAQVKKCLDQVDEARLRSLSTGALYRLQVLGKAFDLSIADPPLKALARELVPAEMRARL